MTHGRPPSIRNLRAPVLAPGNGPPANRLFFPPACCRQVPPPHGSALRPRIARIKQNFAGLMWNVDFAFPWTAFVGVSVFASLFSVQAGEKDQFSFINSKKFSLGSLRSMAALSEHDHQRAGTGTGSEDVRSSLESPRENASHALWHDLPAYKIQNDTDTLHAAYHTDAENICTQTEGVDLPSTTVFT